MYQPQTPYVKIAVDTLDYYFGHGDFKKLVLTGIPDELYQIRRGCFVSIHKNDGDLRGCIGTIEPQALNLVEEISNNVLSAAFNDNRFEPVEAIEMDELEFSVDVLTQPELVFDLDDLDPMIFGIIVSKGDIRRGVLLPGLSGVDTIEKQLEIAKRKAGLRGISNEHLQIERFTSNRYY